MKKRILLFVCFVLIFGSAFILSKKNNLKATTSQESYQARSVCPTGKVAIGGQVNCNEYGSTIRPSIVSSSADTSNFMNNGWIGSCKGNGQITVSSICVDPNQFTITNAAYAQTAHNVDDEISYQAMSVCPTGKVAIGGLVDCIASGITDVRPSMVYSAAEPVNFQNVGWIGACKGMGSVGVIAICVDPSQITTYNGALAETQHITNDEVSYQAVSMCPTGKVAVGGQVNCVGYGDPSTNRPSMVYSAPETDNFQNVGWIGACKGKGSVNVIATCVDPNQVPTYNGVLAENTHYVEDTPTMYNGDGTYTFTEGQKVKLNNGVILEPVYSVTGSGSFEFQNIAFKVYNSSSTYLGITDITRVGWAPHAWSFGGYTFQTSINSIGVYGTQNWSATISASSLAQLPTCTSWSYSNWGTCINGQETRTITSSYPTNCTGGNPILTQSCNGSSDLIVKNIDIRPDGSKNYITVTIQNIGNQSTTLNSTLKLTYGTNISELQSCTVGTCVGNKYTGSVSANAYGKETLSPGEEYNIVFGGAPSGGYPLHDVQFDNSSNYLIKAIIDDNKVITESNENNNTLTKSYTKNPINLIYNIKVVTRENYTKITWNSTEDDKTYLVYDNPENDSRIVSVKDNYTKNHEVILNYLKPNTTYYFQIYSRSGTNNLVESEIFSFKTNTTWVIGKWIKTMDSTTVYFVDSNNVRHAYPNNAIWRVYFGDDFSFVQIVTNDELTRYSLGKNVPYERDRLIKIPSVPKVYKVGDDGTIQWIKTEETAKRLFGNNWAKSVQDLDESFFGDYTEGASIE